MIERICVALVAALLSWTPVAAEDHTHCWACGADAECARSSEERFARKACDSHDFCTTDGCVTYCATGTEECANENSGDPSPWWPFNSPEFSNVLVFSAPSESAEAVADAFDSLLVGVLASRPLKGRHVGHSDGVVVLQDGRSLRFSRTVEVDRRDGFVTVSYQFGKRADFNRVTIESPSRGLEIFVTTETMAGERRFEAFSFGQ